MKRPFAVAIVFGLAITVLLAVMTWTTLRLLRFDGAERQASRQSALEENVGLALWRMDSALAGLIAQENIRPVAGYGSANPGTSLPPTPFVVAHLQVNDAGQLSSPQLSETGRDNGKTDLRAELRTIVTSVNATKLAKHLPPPTAVVEADLFAADLDVDPAIASQSPQARGTREFRSRSRNLQSNTALTQNMVQAQPPSAAAGMAGGVMVPRWLDGHLLLMRRVLQNGRECLQICWLDWQAIQAWLAGMVQDLLPSACVVAAPTETDGQLARRLAALPLLLVPGDLPDAADEPWSALHWSLAVAWGCVLLAAGAVAALLAGVVALSERRAAFVSAVTHELRTPLTTFRMYTEMLAEGMVSSEPQRRSYLETLHSEAERLSRLVENVLAYARLERGRTPGPRETATLGELVDRFKPALGERCRQSNMELVVDVPDAARGRELHTNIGSVEQIVFNLVDNACKYAASAVDRRIHVAASVVGDRLRLSVADHGPGIAKPAAGRLFRPFSKSAEDAARTAPGIGLGLALSRRLAGQLGGKLVLESSNGGATLSLFLPMIAELGGWPS